MTTTDDCKVILERLARIEAVLAHMATNERLARVEAQVSHIHEQVPQIARNALAEAKHDGWQAAKEDAETDNRGWTALVISAVALLASLWASIWGNG